MARIVEFVGSPGVGKSTIFKEVEIRWDKKSCWVSIKHLSSKSPQYNGLIFKFLKKYITGGSHNNFNLSEAGHKFISQHPVFIEACWQNIINRQKVSFNNLDIRFEKAHYLHKQLQKIQMVRDYETDKICVLDEGVVQLIPNGLYKSSAASEEEKELGDIINLVPLPNAIISIDTDARKIAERLYGRNKLISMYRNLDTDKLESLSQLDRVRRGIILECLTFKEIPVLKIDSSLNTSDNAVKIIDFLEKCSGIK